MRSISFSSWWLIAGLVAVAACDGSSSPTAPELEPAIAVIVFADGGALAAHEASIRSLLEDTVRRADALMDVGTVQITVSTDSSFIIPEWGLGGVALGPTEMEIQVDPQFPGLAEVLPDRIPHLAAHETHHVVRWRSVGPASTLLEGLVFEGLADHFAIELTGNPPPPWVEAFPEDQNDLYVERARPELFEPLDFEKWFLGVGTDLPFWTGYTLGYRIVRDYLERNPGVTASSLVNTPASVFAPP